MTQPKDELLAKLELETYRAIGQDDLRGGEGAWSFRVDPNGTDRVALPPAGTHGDVLERVKVAVAAALGGGHLDAVWVDPADHGKGKRKAIVVGGAQAPAADAASGLPIVRYHWRSDDGRWYVADAPDGQRYPVPAGPVNIPPPPPPVAGEPDAA